MDNRCRSARVGKDEQDVDFARDPKVARSIGGALAKIGADVSFLTRSERHGVQFSCGQTAVLLTRRGTTLFTYALAGV